MLGKTIALIGAGRMGGALLHGLLEHAVVSREEIIVSDPDTGRLAELETRYGIGTAVDNAEAARRTEIVVLAVKPQQMDGVIADIAPVIGSDKLVISIAAGVPAERIERSFEPAPRVVRVMPNTPALVGKGMSAVSAGGGATADDIELSLKLFSAVGDAVVLPGELIDAVTAVSGSGPAYFYLLTEALAEAGIRAGLDPGVSAHLAKQTLVGAAAMVELGEQEPAELRAMVTSPGGTTMAALEVFERLDFRGMVTEAVIAARRRAEELASG